MAVDLIFPAISQIPIDFTISKNLFSLWRGDLTVKDADGTLVFKIRRSYTPSKKRLLLDATDNPIFSIDNQGGEWQVFRGDSKDWKNLVFRVEATLQSWLRSELEVFLVAEKLGDLSSDFKVKGSPYRRSCTIYKGSSIVAQTNPMYKIRKVIVARHKFRLTIFPGTDAALIVAFLAVFFNGKYTE